MWNRRDGFRVRIWTTGLNSSTLQYDAQWEAVESLLKILIRFQKGSSRYWCFTSTSPSEGFSSRWVKFRVNRPFQVTQRSIRKILIMTCHLSNEYVQNLEFHPVQTSASNKVIITISDLFSFMWQMLERQKLQTLILVRTSSAMTVEKPSKTIWFI